VQSGTSWNKFAGWYDSLLEADSGTYQKTVILPNLMRAMAPGKGEHILDVGCGQGFFSRAFAGSGAEVIGVDLSARLIEFARTGAPKNTSFHRGNAERMPMVATASIDKAAAVLSLQNMAEAGKAISETGRTVKPGGRIFIVLNHPAFRIPKRSSWGWDEKEKIQYRRIDGYLSEAKEKIEMHPGKEDGGVTYSFHRPLQYYVKALRRGGFAIDSLEEWVSDRKSQPGTRARAEDQARKEIPIFMMISAVKLESARK